jgi:hypothetical protein
MFLGVNGRIAVGDVEVMYKGGAHAATQRFLDD